MNYEQKTLAYLRTGRSLTAISAISEIGTSRVSEYIRRLREKGYNIAMIREDLPNGKWYGRYVLLKQDKMEVRP